MLDVKRRLIKHCLVFLLGLMLLAATKAAYCGGGPRNVLVVVNMSSDISREIGSYYQKTRGIPLRNVCYISCSASETVDSSEYENRIREPIRHYVEQSLLHSRIDYIVVTKGIPLAVDYKDGQGVYSLTSLLTCIDRPEVKSSFINPYGPSAKGTYLAPAPECSFSHSLDLFGQHYYLATRLDAFTVYQVRSMIDSSVHPAADGLFLLDKITTATDYGIYANNRLGTASLSAYACLTTQGRQVICDSTSTFVSNTWGLMGYFGWGGNDPDYSWEKFTSNKFLPGGIADAYYSYSARTFVKPAVPLARDSLVGYMIENGATAVCGYVSEPKVTSCTWPSTLFDRYSKGYNAAESFFMASPMLFWKSTVVGDPLLTPYATPPKISLHSTDKPLTGEALIEAEATDASGVDKVEFYIDDRLIWVDTDPPYKLEFDTTVYTFGPHTLEAVAYEKSPVHTQGAARATIHIVNELQGTVQLGQVVSCEDGSAVSLTGKLVVAGTDIIAGGFYLEEQDRSFGLRVAWPGSVAAGDIVEIAGTLGTVDGERCIVADDVTVVSKGNPLPEPLFISIKYIGGGPFNSITPGYPSSIGLRNYGLLSKVAGIVESVQSCEVVLSMGKNRRLSVKAPAQMSVPLGKMAAATGVIAADTSSSELRPVLILQRTGDLQILKQ